MTTPENIDDLVALWTKKSRGTFDLHMKLDLLKFLQKYLYSQYEPFPEKPDYMDRLFTWVNQVDDDRDKKLLFELASWLVFIGQHEMHSFYRSSYLEKVIPWVVDIDNIDITSSSVSSHIEAALKKTFFGSIAGMEMGSYCRQNGISGQSIRPDFREHSMIGDPASLRKFLSGQKTPFERIVAVEDFVGSGSQMEAASSYLCKLTKYPVLLTPILVAKEGDRVGQELAAKHSHISFCPLFKLPSDVAVPIDDYGIEPPFIKSLREMLKRVYSSTQGRTPTELLFGPYGFEGIGSLVLTYLNCPDNVPPAIHHKSDSWEPLFRRASRES